MEEAVRRKTGLLIGDVEHGRLAALAGPHRMATGHDRHDEAGRSLPHLAWIDPRAIGLGAAFERIVPAARRPMRMRLRGARGEQHRDRGKSTHWPVPVSSFRFESGRSKALPSTRIAPPGSPRGRSMVARRHDRIHPASLTSSSARPQPASPRAGAIDSALMTKANQDAHL